MSLSNDDYLDWQEQAFSDEEKAMIEQEIADYFYQLEHEFGLPFGSAT